MQVKTIILFALISIAFAIPESKTSQDVDKQSEDIGTKKNKRGLFDFGYGYGSPYTSYSHAGIHTNTIITKEVPVAVPHPVAVPIEKHIPYPVIQKVAVPVDRPYPVAVPKPYPVEVPKPVAVPVDRPVPYPVHVPIVKHVPAPYPVKVPYPVPVVKHVAVPYAQPLVVEKFHSYSSSW